jgi:hypothetical protein
MDRKAFGKKIMQLEKIECGKEYRGEEDTCA